jgi:glycosyltransferase involved in cell wall biosynthesis
MDKRNIVLLEPVFAHYREDLYHHLFESDRFEFKIIGGSEYIGIKSIDDERMEKLPYFSMQLFGHQFYWLRGAIKRIFRIRPATVICSGVDFHHIYTIILFILLKGILQKEFYWWSHGTYGNQGVVGIFFRKLFYRTATGLFVYSSEGKNRLLSMGVKEENICVINNALNYTDYGYLNQDIFKKKTNQNQLKILFSGRITPEKELEILIQAIAILQSKGSISVKCSIVGGGNALPYSELVKRLGLTDCIEFTGARYAGEAVSYFLDADIFVYPGGIGLSVLHAMSYGLPVITTDYMASHGPEVELVQPGVDGDFFCDHSPEALADMLLHWNEKLNSHQQEIAQSCIHRIEELEYLPHLMANSLLEFL